MRSKTLIPYSFTGDICDFMQVMIQRNIVANYIVAFMAWI